MIGDNKNLKDQDGNILKLKEENSSLVKKIAGNKFFFQHKISPECSLLRCKYVCLDLINSGILIKQK